MQRNLALRSLLSRRPLRSYSHFILVTQINKTKAQSVIFLSKDLF